MSTESVHSRSKTKRRFFELQPLALTLLASGAILEGQEVYLSADNTVAKRTLGTQFPVGYAKLGAADGAKLAIDTPFISDLAAMAKGGALAAGATVKPDGTDASGLVNYVATAAGDFCQAIVLSGAAAGAEIRVGILRSPVKV